MFRNHIDKIYGSGQLEMIIGPMFSGKTSRLLSEVSKRGINRNVCIICHKFDTRSDKGISTHNKLFNNDFNFPIIIVEKLKDVDVSNFDFIAIDEAQFFSDLNIVFDWLDAGIDVFISSLDADYDRNIIGHYHELIPRSRKLEKLCAYCYECAKEGNPNSLAPHSFKIGGSSSKIFEVGDIDMYVALCEKHWNEFYFNKYNHE